MTSAVSAVGLSVVSGLCRVGGGAERPSISHSQRHGSHLVLDQEANVCLRLVTCLPLVPPTTPHGLS